MAVKQKYQKGFTVIELLIATAVFSVVLLVFLSSFIRVSELFYKGVNLSNTQETARNVLQNISDDIQFYQAPPYVYTSLRYFCIGNHRYTYNLGNQYNPNIAGSYGIVKETITSGCTPPSSPFAPINPADYEELLDPGMQVNSLDVNCRGNRCGIHVHIVFYGEDGSVLSPSATAADAQCSGAVSSSQYCATADYSGTVLQKF